MFTNSANTPIEIRFMLIMACPFSFLVGAKEKCFLHPKTERAGGSFDQLKRRDDMSDNANPVRSTSLQSDFLSTWLPEASPRTDKLYRMPST